MLQVDILLLYSNKIHTVRDKANISLRRRKKNKKNQNHRILNISTKDLADKFPQWLPSN